MNLYTELLQLLDRVLATALFVGGSAKLGVLTRLDDTTLYFFLYIRETASRFANFLMAFVDVSDEKSFI